MGIALLAGGSTGLGIGASTYQPLVAGGSTELGVGVFNTPTLGGRRFHRNGGLVFSIL